ncbi:hypothetical protein E2C01_048456 [Portunus trituberculatus]|uniref:Uncharacterized protein n=1 Tax=Portunus trituberculatus TaxID=210409 RepID=A0A5B7GB27_PORTR|nr:hypothetical protein [Portunus trituberculatus]
MIITNFVSSPFTDHPDDLAFNFAILNYLEQHRSRIALVLILTDSGLDQFRGAVNSPSKLVVNSLND